MNLLPQDTLVGHGRKVWETLEHLLFVCINIVTDTRIHSSQKLVILVPMQYLAAGAAYEYKNR